MLYVVQLSVLFNVSLQFVKLVQQTNMLWYGTFSAFDILTAQLEKRKTVSDLRPTAKILIRQWIPGPIFPIIIWLAYFYNSKAFTAVLAIFRSACAEMVLFQLLVQTLLLSSFSVTSISYKSIEILAIWQCLFDFWTYLLRVNRSGNFWASRQTEYRDPHFLEELKILMIGKH